MGYRLAISGGQCTGKTTLAYVSELHRGGRMSAKELEILADIARMWAQSYTLHIVPSPRDCRMEDDGVRWLDEAARDRIHDRVITIISALGLPYIEVSGTVEQRTEQVMDELMERGIIGD